MRNIAEKPIIIPAFLAVTRTNFQFVNSVDIIKKLCNSNLPKSRALLLDFDDC